MTSQTAQRLTTFRQQMADFARGQLLVDLRERRHLSQEDAAHEIGVSTKSLRAWEHGGKIRWPNAKRVGAFYAVDPESLVSRDAPGETPDVLGTFNGELPADLDIRLARLERGVQRLLEAQGLRPETDDEVTQALDALAEDLERDEVDDRPDEQPGQETA
jgi:DNA-binding XRE family transcriptional regulator